jgi:hypothetical protein
MLLRKATGVVKQKRLQQEFDAEVAKIPGRVVAIMALLKEHSCRRYVVARVGEKVAGCESVFSPELGPILSPS